MQELRNSLALARQQWADCAALLSRIRDEVSRCLALRKMSEEDSRAMLDAARAGNPGTAEGMEDFRSAALGMPAAELRRIFIESDHLLNLPMARQSGLLARVILPSLGPLTAAQCRNCGDPIPKGKRKYCSARCRAASRERRQETVPAGSEMPFPGTETVSPPQVRTGHGQALPSPCSGEGDRDLDCVYYEACLDLAVLEDWESFHCEGCRLRQRVERKPSSGRTPAA